MTILEPIAASAADLDRELYRRLLARFTPKVIETAAEHEAALVSDLISRFEEKSKTPMPDAQPLDILKELMMANDLKAIDLAELLGGRSRVSEILSGKRSISKEQAKRLGTYFRLSPAAFL